MSKELNTNQGYYQPGTNMYYSSYSYSDGSKSRSYSRDDLPGSTYPTYTEDVDMRQPNYAAINYATDSYNSVCNTREANQAPINAFNSYSTSYSNIGGTTSFFREGQYEYGRSRDNQEPVSTFKGVRSAYTDSFVTYNINNQDPIPTLQQQTMERDTVSDVNPMYRQNYNTQTSVQDSYISSGQPLWQNKDKNASIRVIPATELKGKVQNPADPRFILIPKEPTFNVKIIGGVRIAQEVTKISYRKSLKHTAVYTKGRKGGICKKALAESKRKRASWWLAQGKTVEEALWLCLKPYHEIYEEILEKKHSWSTPMMVRNLLEQINKEGVYNPFIGRPEADDSDTSDDSTDEETEQIIMPQVESTHNYHSTNNNLGMNFKQNVCQNSSNLMVGSMPTQDKIQTVPIQQKIGNSSSQNASYDPTSHFLNSLTDRNRPLPVNSKKNNPYVKVNTPKTKITTNQNDPTSHSLNSLADRNRPLPVNPEVSELIHTKKNNSYVKVNTPETQTTRIPNDPTSHSLNSLADHNGPLPVNSEVTELIQTKKNNPYVKVNTPKTTTTSIQNDPTSHSLNSLADHNGPLPVHSEVSELIHTKKNNPYVKVNAPETETTRMPNDISGASLRRYYYWLHVGKTPKVARALCVLRMHRIPLYTNKLRHTVGSLRKVIKPSQIKAMNHGMLSLADIIPAFSQKKDSKLQQRQNMEKVNKRNEKINKSTFQSSKHTNDPLTQSALNKNNCDSSSISIIPTDQIQTTIEEDFTKDTHIAHTGDNETEKHANTEKTEDNAKKQQKTKQLTNAELIRFEWWKKQGKSEEEARNLCHKSMAVSEALNYISSHKKERGGGEEFRSNIPDISQNPRRREKSNKQMSGENAIEIETDAMAQINFPRNVTTEEDHILPIAQNLVVPSNLKDSEQREYKVCIKANKDKINFSDLKAIKNSLNQCIADEDDIKIKSFNKRINRVIITCLNEYTRDWLDKQIPSLVPWENAQLEIVDEDEVPIDIFARFFIPFDTEKECSSLTPEHLMQQLHEQNPDAGCDRWIVHKVEAKTSPIGVYVLGCIDNKSSVVLDSKNKILKWYEKRNIKVKVSSTKKNNKNESGTRAILFVPDVPECRLHSSQQSLLNKLHKLNPTIGCNGWTILKKIIKQDGAMLLVRLNNSSKNIVINKNKLSWYRSQNIDITIVPIYIDINLPIDNECKYLRSIPLNQINKTLINKLHFFNPSFGCLKWIVVQLKDKVDKWRLTAKINEQCHQTIINRGYKLYWYGDRWLTINLGNVPELQMMSKKNINPMHCKKPDTSYQPKENITEINLNQNSSGNIILSPQLMVNEESKVQDTSNLGIPPMLWSNPETSPDISKLSSSRQNRSTDVSYTERDSYHYEKHNEVGSDFTERLSPARKYAMPQIPESARRSPAGHGQGLGLVGFEEKEDEAYGSRRIHRYDDEGSKDIYRLESTRDACYSSMEHRNVENIDYNIDYNQTYYNNDNRQEEEESRHSPYQNHGNLGTDSPRSRDDYTHHDIEGYHFDEHHHNILGTYQKIDDVREDMNFETGERHSDWEERNFDQGDRYIDREEITFNREEGNFNTEERYFERYLDREKSPVDSPRLDSKHRSRHETECFQREWSPDHQNRSKNEHRWNRSRSRDDQRQRKTPLLWTEPREALHDNRETLNQNKRAREREDRRHDALIDRLKGLADYRNRDDHYQERSSYSNRGRHNSNQSFDAPPSKRRKRRR